jgi:hypothetical protein
MICPAWRGWTTKQDAGAYQSVVRGEAIPGTGARRIPGLRAIDLVRRDRENDVEFMTLTWVRRPGSVREFIGEDNQAAHVPPQAQAVLAAVDHQPAHYEVPDRREQPR